MFWNVFKKCLILCLMLSKALARGAGRCFRCAGMECNTMDLESCPSDRAICQVIFFFLFFWTPLLNSNKTFLSLYSKKMTTTTGNVSVYVKGCSDQCIDENVINVGPTTITYNCCYNDLCNSANFGFGSKLLTVALLLFAIKYLHSKWAAWWLNILYF